MKELSLLTIEESARIVGVSKQTIYDWIKGGYAKRHKLPYLRKGSLRLIKFGDLMRANQIYADVKIGVRDKRKFIYSPK